MKRLYQLNNGERFSFEDHKYEKVDGGVCRDLDDGTERILATMSRVEVINWDDTPIPVIDPLPSMVDVTPFEHDPFDDRFDEEVTEDDDE